MAYVLLLAVTTSHVHAIYVETTRLDTHEAVSENYFINIPTKGCMFRATLYFASHTAQLVVNR